MPKMTEGEKRRIREEYLEEYPNCQYTAAIPEQPWGIRTRKGDQVCVEHIWNRKGPMSEHWSNYATVWNGGLGGPHRWKEDHLVEARIVITAFKFDLMLRSGDARHFDLEALKECSGYWIPGWVEQKLSEYGDRLPEWVIDSGRSFLERFEANRGR